MNIILFIEGSKLDRMLGFSEALYNFSNNSFTAGISDGFVIASLFVIPLSKDFKKLYIFLNVLPITPSRFCLPFDIA